MRTWWVVVALVGCEYPRPADVVPVFDGPGGGDVERPTIDDYQPASASTGNGLDVVVSFMFSEDVTNFDESKVQLLDGATPVPVMFDYNAGTRYATLTPMSPLVTNTAYRVALSPDIEDAAGNKIRFTFAMDPWMFTTTICPATYASVTGGQDNHVYRRISTTATHVNQHAACYADTGSTGRSYLGIPDNASELLAMNSLAPAGVRWWIGLHDGINEGTFVTITTNTAHTFLPWAAGQPDNVPAQADCVEVNHATQTFFDNDCLATNVAICECEP